jgi:hypothetical protein
MSTVTRLEYSTLIDRNIYREAARWCEQQYGPRNDLLKNRQGVWNVLWNGMSDNNRPSQYRFNFASEQDLVLFILRWK